MRCHLKFLLKELEKKEREIQKGKEIKWKKQAGKGRKGEEKREKENRKEKISESTLSSYNDH